MDYCAKSEARLRSHPPGRTAGGTSLNCVFLSEAKDTVYSYVRVSVCRIIFIFARTLLAESDEIPLSDEQFVFA